MLVELHVADLGIVDDLAVLLGPGLTAITGETGAGKTLLVTALELLLGGRADASVVRAGRPEARVAGRFVTAEGDELVLGRVVPADGRSRAYVDGRPAAVGELAALGESLVDLHGQHAHRSLVAPAVQRAALDRFAGPPALDARRELRAARAAARGIAAELDGLGGDARARARELDLLRFQVDEIAAAALSGPDDDEALAREEALLADAVAHRDALAAAQREVDGGALDALGRAIAALGERPPGRDAALRLRALQAELADVARDLRVGAEAIADDPTRLDAVRARRRLLHELRRKYGETLAEVLAFAEEAEARRSTLEGYEARATVLEAARREAGERAERAAAALSGARRAAGGPLATEVTDRLHELAMPAARLEVRVEPAEPGEDGADTVTFLLAPNPGEPARPLARAASGGELSRAMLALRLVLSEAPPTLVFDEVDAGIGGEAGTAVGRHLAALAADRQVLCVTHLAQVAACADAQVVVEKREDGGRTVVQARTVEGDGRVVELSRMLAGVGESDHARRHAAELLDAARSRRGAVR